MSEIKSFRDIKAWQIAMRLCRRIYETTQSFPSDERFGLTNQMRRGAVAVPSNMAEGYGRQSTHDYVRFLRIARGCLYELDTQAELAEQLRFLPAEVHAELSDMINECSRTLGGLIRSLDPGTTT